MEEKIIARRDEDQRSFDELLKQKEQKQQELREIDLEMAKLQGEYRLIDDLLSTKAKASKVSPEPNVVDVDEAVKE